MNRRDVLRGIGAATMGMALPKSGQLLGTAAERGRWRRFEVTTRIAVLKPSGITRIWAPAALDTNTPYQRTLGNAFHSPGGKSRIVEIKPDGLKIVAAEFGEGVRPVLTMVSTVSTRDWSADFSAPARVQKPSAAELKHFLRPTKLLPTDGIVKETALAITHTATTDVGKARAIYEWIVENTYRNAKTRGCGLGNIKFMLESRDFGGKCADLNALYVGLARAAGLPARDVYGIRVAKSQLGYKSLGTSSQDISKAQHCRAEVYLNEYGWVAVDPADVRKVMLEEPPGNRTINDDMVKEARVRLFGAWEMNWMAYNFAHDVVLPGSIGSPLAFLMYPQAETSEGRLDSLDPEAFEYRITAREIS